MPDKIIKRNGRVADFQPQKIAMAVFKASVAAGTPDHHLADELSNKVAETLDLKYPGGYPTVEEIQNEVEKSLIAANRADVAKAYIIYRQRRAEIRAAKHFYGVTDDLKLSVNAVRVLNRRYLIKNERGQVAETPRQLFQRVARTVAAPDAVYGVSDISAVEAEFFREMAELKFLPNSPTLMNAGTDIGQLSACFVLPVPDSIAGIFATLGHMAEIHKSGGGTGFSFSRLRPVGDVVRTTAGIASGPVSFMRIYDVATEVIKQGGRRRGANMGILRVDHPDILEFITCKEREDFLPNFNISVAVTDDFMRAAAEGTEYDLVNPRTGTLVKRLNAKNVLDLIVTMAWRTGDPGLVFIDRINEANPTPNAGEIESTNPCGEQPLLPNESCNLGSLNLAKFVANGKVDWDELGKSVALAVHFLDNVIDAGHFPLPEIEKLTKANRKIGLGVMGFAEALIMMGIPYNSEEALQTGEKLMKFISERAIAESVDLADQRGSFPNFSGSLWERRGFKGIRNSTVTTVAPTGTISIIAGTSSGVEPLFALSFVRHVMEGTRLLEVNPLFENEAKRSGLYSDELMQKIARSGSIRRFSEIPEGVRDLYVTTFDIDPEWHVRMQAAFQKYTDNAVSKTVNLPAEATFDDVIKIYLLAYELKCKGITVYRYGSKKTQVLNIEAGRSSENAVTAEAEYSGGCLTGECSF